MQETDTVHIVRIPKKNDSLSMLYTTTHNDWHSAWFEISILPSRELIETDNYPEKVKNDSRTLD
jgi:hypothetical protein